VVLKIFCPDIDYHGYLIKPEPEIPANPDRDMYYVKPGGREWI
jgi:hypothetical protein